MFGWDPDRKGVDIAFQASELLQKRGYHNVLLLIVSGENKEDFKSEQINSVTTSVRIIPPQENVSDLFTLADCFLSASRREAFSYAIGEAMAAGLPIVSSDLPHLKSIYGKAKGYFTFKSENPAELAKTQAHLLDLPKTEWDSFSAANKSFIEENLGISKWCKNIIDLYECLLDFELLQSGGSIRSY